MTEPTFRAVEGRDGQWQIWWIGRRISTGPRTREEAEKEARELEEGQREYLGQDGDRT